MHCVSRRVVLRIPRKTAAACAAMVAVTAAAGPAAADGWPHGGRDAFSHAGTFSVPANLRAGEPIDTVTSAEIVAATDHGRTLLYTDSPLGRLGFIDIRQPSAPAAGGTLDMGGEPTSVATVGDFALVVARSRPARTQRASCGRRSSRRWLRSAPLTAVRAPQGPEAA
jgi:hypothetical protein